MPVSFGYDWERSASCLLTREIDIFQNNLPEFIVKKGAM